MAWLRVDDRVRTHPKVVAAGPAAAWFWFCGVCYCREHLTDGFIPGGMVASLAPGVVNGRTLAKKLVDVRLWHEEQGGYRVHDFLEWNPSRAEVMATRDADKSRKRKGFQPESTQPPNGIPTTPSRDHAGGAGLGSSGVVLSENGNSESADLPVAEFFDGYRERYQRITGGTLPLLTSPKDFAIASELLRTWPLPRLLDMAELWMHRTDRDVAGKPKTLAWFKPMAPWADTRLREAGR